MNERQIVIENKIEYPEFGPISFTIHYSEVDSHALSNTNDSHIHDECEIYYNLSGDICFMVEKNVYPIKPGSIIIMRPNEYHHCIYLSNALHRHYWILLSAPKQHNSLLSRFYNRPLGEKNHIQLDGEDADRFERMNKKLVFGMENVAERYELLFGVLKMIDKGCVPESDNGTDLLLRDIRLALDYIAGRLPLPVKVEDVAEAVHVSVNTLERHFTRSIGIRPAVYIKEKRLILAKELMRNGLNVQETCEGCGYTDCSRFIAAFRKRFGITPYEFKKQYFDTDHTRR